MIDMFSNFPSDYGDPCINKNIWSKRKYTEESEISEKIESKEDKNSEDNSTNQTKTSEDSEHHKIQESEGIEDTGLNDLIQEQKNENDIIYENSSNTNESSKNSLSTNESSENSSNTDESTENSSNTDESTENVSSANDSSDKSNITADKDSTNLNEDNNSNNKNKPSKGNNNLSEQGSIQNNSIQQNGDSTNFEDKNKSINLSDKSINFPSQAQFITHPQESSVPTKKSKYPSYTSYKYYRKLNRRYGNPRLLKLTDPIINPIIIPNPPNPIPVIIRPGVVSSSSVPPDRDVIKDILREIEEAERIGKEEVVLNDFDLMQKGQEFLDIIAKVIKSRLINLAFNNCKIPKDFNWVNKNSSLEKTRDLYCLRFINCQLTNEYDSNIIELVNSIKNLSSLDLSENHFENPFMI